MKPANVGSTPRFIKPTMIHHSDRLSPSRNTEKHSRPTTLQKSKPGSRLPQSPPYLSGGGVGGGGWKIIFLQRPVLWWVPCQYGRVGDEEFGFTLKEGHAQCMELMELGTAFVRKKSVVRFGQS